MTKIAPHSQNHEDAANGHPNVSADVEGELSRLKSKLRQAEDEISRARNELRENEDEITRLHAYIFEKTRFKNLAKDLVLKFDAVIMLRLSKKVKAKKRYPTMVVRKDEDIIDLLREVKRTDLKVFASKPGILARLEVIFFKSVFTTYREVKKIIIIPLKYAKRQLKKKRGAHHA